MEEILEDKKPEAVPLSKFLDVKKEKKELEAKVRDLQEQVRSGADKREVNAELKDIADKYDVDPKFLSELSDIIYSKAKGDVEEQLNSKLKPLEARDKEEKINKAFEQHYQNAISVIPEYEAVVNKDVIKTLSLLPANSKKTFQQIIEETYGNSVTGKKTMEKSTPRGGKTAELDSSRLKDPSYYKEVMSNPELKKEYNKGLVDRINL
jgi:hypothetical protein